ncbi:MAG: HAMP domain-containing histidine kinase [Desulfobacterales bacterium]|nr:HAMP domain-containing histidine kinase [Desulfobacterales bacterium]
MESSYSVWIEYDNLEKCWHPNYFAPEYIDIDRIVDSQSDNFCKLRDLIEVVIRTYSLNHPKETAHCVIRLQGGFLEYYENNDFALKEPVFFLPTEAIILNRLVTPQLQVCYWDETMFPGKGITSDDLIVLKSQGTESIAWIVSQLRNKMSLLQLQRTILKGILVPLISIDSLLDIKIQKLSKKERERLNLIVRENLRSQLAMERAKSLVIDAQKEVKPFLLTGATFEERLTQFEDYLLEQRLINPEDGFFVEASTIDHSSDMFVVRPIKGSIGIPRENKVIYFTTLNEPPIESEWKKWYWSTSVKERFRIFNSLTASDSLPSYLLSKMMERISEDEDTQLLNETILPSFSMFRDAYIFFKDNDEPDIEDISRYLSFSWLKFHSDLNKKHSLKKLVSYFNLDINSDWGSLSENHKFMALIIKWFRSAFKPAIALKVIRDDKIAGIYILFGPDQFDRPVEIRALLEGYAIKLNELINQPSEFVNDAARRESLRRLSDIMHRLNGPTGRAISVIEDIQKYLSLNPNIGNNLVPDEKTAYRRVNMGRKSIEEYTLKARVNDIARAIEEIRTVAYKIKRLNLIQNRLNLNGIDLRKIIAHKAHQCGIQIHELKVDISLPDEPLMLNADEEALSDAIDEVFNNACREIQEQKTKTPEIKVQAFKDKNNVVFAISDNALPTNDSLILQPFEEGSSSYARSGRGSGFGLVFVRETIRRHGGTCRLIENVDNDGNRIEGVSFKASLPLYKI